MAAEAQGKTRSRRATARQVSECLSREEPIPLGVCGGYGTAVSTHQVEVLEVPEELLGGLRLAGGLRIGENSVILLTLSPRRY